MCRKHWMRKRHAQHWHNHPAELYQQSRRRGWAFQPPANVAEASDRFELHLVAPGRTKDDFKVGVKDGVLTVSVDTPTAGEEAMSIKRQEFELVGFERQFKLNSKIDPEGISANYQDGILKVTLPKIEGADAPDYEIDIV